MSGARGGLCGPPRGGGTCLRTGERSRTRPPPGPDEAARGLPGGPGRRRAGSRQADRHDHRRPRPALGGRVALLSPLAHRGQARARIASSSSRTQRRRAASILQGLPGTRARTCPASPSASAASGCAPRRTCSSSPIKPGEDKPAGPAAGRPRRLETCKAKHNVFNGLTWGPDGWLYGCNGILSNSRVGKPGTPDEKRVAAQLRRLALSSDHGSVSRRSPAAPPTPGAWTSTITARCSSPIASSSTSSTSSRGRTIKRMYGQDLNPHVTA